MYLPESARYLYCRGDFTSARNSLIRVARFNNNLKFNEQFVFETEMVEMEMRKEESGKEK